MKKLVSMVLMGFAILVALVSCKKMDDLVPVQKERATIHMATKDQASLKSASVDMGIADGDTVDGVFDIETLMWVDKYGAKFSGKWKIELVNSDFSGNTHILVDMNTFTNFYTGDQISNVFSEHGLYKVTYGRFVTYDMSEVLATIYVRVNGIPGRVGDGHENDFIFRMEKKTLFNPQSQKWEDLIFLYFKYEMVPQDGAAWCLLESANSNLSYPSQFSLKRWPFSSEQYYYLILRPEPGVRAYTALFAHAMDQTIANSGYYVDVNNQKSSYNRHGKGIEFAISSPGSNGETDAEVPISAGELSNVSMEQTENYLFVANKDDGRIYVFTNNADHKLVKTFAIEGKPSQLLFYRDYAYNLSVILVPLSNMKKIKVIDVETLKLRDDIATPKIPYFLAADTDKLFATVSSDNGSDFVPFMIWFTADRPYGSTIQTTWGNNNSFSGNEQIMVDSPNRFIYIGNRGYSPDNISKYKITSSASVEFVKENNHGSLGSNGIQFVFDRDKNKIYLASGSGGTSGYNIQIVNPTDLTKVADLSLGSYPNAVGFDANYIYAGKDAYYDNDDVKVFDRSSYAYVRSYSFDQSETLVDRGISANWSVYAATNRYIYYLTGSAKTKIFDFTTGRPFKQ